MPRRLFIFDEPDRFVAGAVGEPGSRAFYLQARQGGVLVTVALEKAQVAALAERMSDLLDAVQDASEPGPQDTAALDEPLIELFRVGAMAIAWDSGTSNLVIEAQTLSEDGDYVEVDDTDEEGPDLLRVRIGSARARGFVRRAAALIAAGRPPCPYCGEPLSATGHFCTQRNGLVN